MGALKNRKRWGLSIEKATYDTLFRMKADTMVDASKLANKAIDEFLIRNGYEIRENTEEENELNK